MPLRRMQVVSAPPPTRKGTSWLSLYLYPRESLESICAELPKILRGLEQPGDGLRRFFFIRYRDWLGAHVRLRIHCLDSGQRSESIQFLGDYFHCVPREAARYWSGTDHAVVKGLRLVGYRPEISRYGGRQRIATTENYFTGSSRWAINLLASGAGDPKHRWLIGAVCAYIAVEVAYPSPPERRTVLRNHARGYGRIASNSASNPDDLKAAFDEYWRINQTALCRGFALAQAALAVDEDEPFAAWARTIRESIVELDATFRPRVPGAASSGRKRDRVVFSWIHMHLNRLGIGRSDEALILNCISRHADQDFGGGSPPDLGRNLH